MSCFVVELKDRPEWLAERRGSIGSSDSPSLWGVGYASQSLYALWAQKAHGIEVEWSKSDLRRLALGKAAEPIIREWFSEEIGMPVQFDGDHCIRKSTDHPLMAASLDGWLEHWDYGFCPTELKKIGIHNRQEWFTDDGLPITPLKYQVQLAHQMIVTEATHGYVVAVIGDDELLWRVVELSPEFADMHVQKCRDFWQLVEAKTPPPVDGTPATTEAIKKLWPEPDPSKIADLPEESDSWTEEIEQLSNFIKTLEERRDSRKNAIRSAIGSAEEGITPAGTRWTYHLKDVPAYTVPAKSYRELRRAGKGRRRKK